MEHKIIPKGLRIPIFPAERISSPGLLVHWEQELTDSSLRLMNLLLTEERVFFGHSSTKLKELIDLVLSFKGDPDFNKRESSLQTAVERFQGLIKERKHRQFNKDLKEFREKRAYQQDKKSLPPSESELSSSEQEFSDYDSAQVRGRNQPRRGHRGRGRPNRRWPRSHGQRGRDGGSFSSSPPSTSMATTVPNTRGDFLSKDSPYQLRDRMKGGEQ